ncbi:hypothetical protein B0H63DRAFT_543820 [Podospora didyma]|uniref:Uncharacterized protein n=1 Tax=Podospora didyma TaxID=330526 RepID=A0AAE0TZW0_9PEZI|nr:hypothetical protein B0H63DRAFT_543820 [Podospora didyma]
MTDTTIIITGANGSAALHAVDHILTHSPSFTLALVVRNASEADPNVWIRQLDLAHLQEVHDFSRTVASEISKGTLPLLAGIVCNAYWWNLVDPMEVIPPTIPAEMDKLDLLVKPLPDDPAVANHHGYGSYRYGMSKLAGVMWGHALNRRLEKDQDAKLQNITVAILNQGGITDLRAMPRNTPRGMVVISKVMRPLVHVVRWVKPYFRLAAYTGADMARMATNEACSGERGYFTLLKKD